MNFEYSIVLQIEDHKGEVQERRVLVQAGKLASASAMLDAVYAYASTGILRLALDSCEVTRAD